jgi:hypothetical protein
MTASNIALLTREYYNFNDWSVSALSVLTRTLLRVPEPHRDEVVARAERLGSFLLRIVDDDVALDPIDWRALLAFATDASRGKALFLDLMGFGNPEIMAGRPDEADIASVVASYRDRLRPRHHAIARLAREGAARVVVTTNYDLLLEGAYRMVGFLDRESTTVPDDVSRTSAPHYTCIAGAEQFFARGEGQRTALLLKIHGSADVYRDVRRRRLDALKADSASVRRPSNDPWARYLPAVVFTYREIQTWRADAWSRDLIRTLLRTHTLALCGYSGADPVLHSTFREVYEERAGANVDGDPRKKDGADAPAFYFGMADKREFHSLEILRAASDAARLRKSKLVEHPNLIAFERSSGFPNIDDHFRWIVHCVVRDLQSQALTARLRSLSPHLLGYPCPDADFTALCKRFADLRARECAMVRSATDPSRPLPDGVRRRMFEQVVDWTWCFVPGLLRELALAELVESRQGVGGFMRIRRSFPWYQPAAERLEWTAWSAILELGLRRMVDAWAGNAHASEERWLAAEDSPHAAVSFARGTTEGVQGGRKRGSEEPCQPYALCIRLAGFERQGRSVPLTGAFRRVTYWEFAEGDVLWPRTPTDRSPTPEQLWRWAAGAPIDATAAADHLGVPTC